MASRKSKSAKAARMVSKYLADMADIKDEYLDDIENPRMCTRAEKLAEIIWKKALGFKETDIKTGLEVEHKPNLAYLKILLERMEGRVLDVSVTESKKSIADKVSESSKAKINKIAEESDN